MVNEINELEKIRHNLILEDHNLEILKDDKRFYSETNMGKEVEENILSLRLLHDSFKQFIITIDEYKEKVSFYPRGKKFAKELDLKDFGLVKEMIIAKYDQANGRNELDYYKHLLEQIKNRNLIDPDLTEFIKKVKDFKRFIIEHAKKEGDKDSVKRFRAIKNFTFIETYFDKIKAYENMRNQVKKSIQDKSWRYFMNLIDKRKRFSKAIADRYGDDREAELLLRTLNRLEDESKEGMNWRILIGPHGNSGFFNDRIEHMRNFTHISSDAEMNAEKRALDEFGMVIESRIIFIENKVENLRKEFKDIIEGEVKKIQSLRYKYIGKIEDVKKERDEALKQSGLNAALIEDVKKNLTNTAKERIAYIRQKQLIKGAFLKKIRESPLLIHADDLEKGFSRIDILDSVLRDHTTVKGAPLVKGITSLVNFGPILWNKVGKDMKKMKKIEEKKLSLVK